MYYPTTDDLLNSVGLMRVQHRASPLWMTPAMLFGAGVLVGATSALLFTPKTGRDLRHDIQDAASSLTGTVKDAASTVSESVRDVLPSRPSINAALTHRDRIEAK